MPNGSAAAAKEIRTTVTVLAATVVLWFLTAPAVTAALQKRSNALHLAAYFSVSDAFSRVASPGLDDVPVEGASCVVGTPIPVQSGTEEENCVEVVVNQFWPGLPALKGTIARLQSEMPAFRIAAPGARIPVDEYIIAEVRDEFFVLPRRYTGDRPSPRALFNAVLRDHLDAPVEWNAIVPMIQAEGWSGSSVKDLKLTDKAVASYIQQGFTSSHTVSGLPVPSGWYPAAICVFLGLAGISLIGPYLLLRKDVEHPGDEPWFMLASTDGRLDRALFGGQVLVSLLLAASPIVLIASQFRLAPLMQPAERAVWFTSLAGPVVAAGMIVLVAREIARRRNASRPPAETALA